MTDPQASLPMATDTALAGALAQLSLDEKQTVDRARDILMRQMNMNDVEAYALLTEMAGKRKTGLADMSLQLLKVSRVLTI